jgi:putative ABC transport system permease protein
VIEATATISRQAQRRRVTVDDVNGVLREEPAPLWSYHIVTPSYFRVYGLPIVRGRDFADGEASAEAVIIDEPTARYLWGNADPLGRMIKLGDMQSDLPWHKIVGVVGDLRDTFAIRRRVPTANFALKDVYRVMTPADSIVLYNPNPFGYARGWMSVYARVRGNTELAALRMERMLRTASSGEQPSAFPLEYMQIGYERERHDFASSLFSAFALVGVGLVAIGVFGIVTHSIEERRRELAVRISLGATARDILHALLREGNVLILSGVALGLLLIKPSIFWLSAFIDDETDPYNALLFAAIAVGLFALAVVAAYIPALRATRIDPVEALRHE